MDAITMPSIHSMISKLKQDFTQFNFELADEFWWASAQNTIYINPKTPNSDAYTLHELSHALLDHQGYERDIELIKLERDAWEYAKNTLSATYDVAIDDTIVQDNLDTYRRWLHTRSTCPECSANGLQTKDHIYKCLACGHQWRVNEARLCALRRYTLQTK